MGLRYLRETAMDMRLCFPSEFSLAQPLTGRSLTAGGRTLLVAWSLFLLAGFAVAGRLKPDPRGFGTHEALGLPACTFRQIAGVPCPSCGMTTSFAHFVRGELITAGRVNAAGLLLAACCAVQIPWCWVSAWRGTWWGLRRPGGVLLWVFLALSTVCALQWAVRLWSA